MENKNKMNKYYFSDRTEKITESRPDGSFTMVTSMKDFDTFVNDYEVARFQGNSIIDSLEIAR